MANKLDLAEAQFLGYFHHQNNVPLDELVRSMGLKKSEWKNIKSNYGITYMSEADLREIDQMFSKEVEK